MAAREFVDPPAELEAKLQRLVELARAASGSIVIFTGAGISTAAGIPDIRGEHGLDTKPVPLVVLGAGEQVLEWKRPTFAHAAVTALVSAGIASFVATSNHDGLHFPKTPLPVLKCADVFGNAYTEKCLTCGTHFNRSVLVPTGILGRVCDVAGCGGRLTKTGTRMGASTPEVPLRAATAAASAAKLALVLGSSMSVTPFCDLPPMAEAYVLCTLQETSYDRGAALCLHTYVDTVMRRLVAELGVTVPPVEYRQEFNVSITEAAGGGLTVAVLSPRQAEPVTCVAALRLVDAAGAELLELTPEFSSFELRGILSAADRARIAGLEVDFPKAAQEPGLRLPLTPETAVGERTLALQFQTAYD